MKLNSFLDLISDSREDIINSLNDLIDSPRNRLLDIHRQYYDGKHWQITEGRGNQTMSGKRIWGGKSTTANPEDVFKRGQSNKEVSFGEGQLQIRNYISKTIQVYQDYIVGDDGDIEIEWADESDANASTIGDFLKSLWFDSDVFLKEQVARGVLNTVSCARLNYDDDEGYYVTVEDARDIFPIYVKDKRVGTLVTYPISAEQAKDLGVQSKGEKNKQSVYAEAFYKDTDDEWYFVKIVDGVIVNESGEPEILLPELAFDPFDIVSNLDHPFNKFDDNDLEASEIFALIDKNDAYNANSTIEFLTNLFLASPKVSIDLEMLKELHLTLDDPGIQDAINKFQYSPYTIDSLPIKVNAGNSIPESFYTGMANIKDGIFEDAGIPQFILSGSLPSGLAVETVELGMTMLEKKINQKRKQLVKLIQMISAKALKAKKLVDEPYSEIRSKIKVVIPPVISLSTKDVIGYLQTLAQNGVLPNRYAAHESLRLMNRAEDIETIEELEQESLGALRVEIETKKNLAQSAIEAERVVQEREAQKRALQETEQRIQALA